MYVPAEKERDSQKMLIDTPRSCNFLAKESSSQCYEHDRFPNILPATACSGFLIQVLRITKTRVFLWKTPGRRLEDVDTSRKIPWKTRIH